MTESSWKNRSNVPLDGKPPAKPCTKRQVRPLIKPLEIPQPPPTAFDLFYEEEKQKWNKEYRQNLLGCSSCLSQARLGKRMRRALALRWTSLAEEERAQFEDKAKQQSACIQRDIAHYKYMTGQLNPTFLYAVHKDGTLVNSIDWSKQIMAPPSNHHRVILQKEIDSTHHSASLLLHSRFGNKQAPMSPPPPILSPPVLSTNMGLSARSPLPQPPPKPARSEPPAFQSTWSVMNTFDHRMDSLIRDMAGSCATRIHNNNNIAPTT